MGLGSGHLLTSKNTTAAPYPRHCTCKGVLSVGGHGRLDDFQRLSQSGDLEQVQPGTEEQVAELDGLLLDMGDTWGRFPGHSLSGHRKEVFVIVCPDQGRRWASSPGGLGALKRYEGGGAVGYCVALC